MPILEEYGLYLVFKLLSNENESDFIECMKGHNGKSVDCQYCNHHDSNSSAKSGKSKSNDAKNERYRNIDGLANIIGGIGLSILKKNMNSNVCSHFDCFDSECNYSNTKCPLNNCIMFRGRQSSLYRFLTKSMAFIYYDPNVNTRFESKMQS